MRDRCHRCTQARACSSIAGGSQSVTHVLPRQNVGDDPQASGVTMHGMEHGDEVLLRTKGNHHRDI
jgi:hypothetical protein